MTLQIYPKFFGVHKTVTRQMKITLQISFVMNSEKNEMKRKVYSLYSGQSNKKNKNENAKL